MISNTVIKEEKCLNPLQVAQSFSLGLQESFRHVLFCVFRTSYIKLNKLLDQMLGIFVIGFVMYCTHSHSPLHHDLDIWPLKSDYVDVYNQNQLSATNTCILGVNQNKLRTLKAL